MAGVRSSERRFVTGSILNLTVLKTSIDFSGFEALSCHHTKVGLMLRPLKVQSKWIGFQEIYPATKNHQLRFRGITFAYEAIMKGASIAASLSFSSSLPAWSHHQTWYAQIGTMPHDDSSLSGNRNKARSEQHQKAQLCMRHLRTYVP